MPNLTHDEGCSWVNTSFDYTAFNRFTFFIGGPIASAGIFPALMGLMHVVG